MKKTYIIATLLAALCTFSAAAQDEFRRIEFEPSVGIAIPGYGGGEGFKAGIAPSLALELRYNLNSLPMSVGLEAAWTSAAVTRSAIDAGQATSNCNSAALSLTADYYLRRGGRTAFFIGAGVGIADRYRLQTDTDYAYNPLKHAAGCVFTPHIGVEFWNHLRLTLDARIAGRDYSTVEFRIGYAFGGGKRQ